MATPASEKPGKLSKLLDKRAALDAQIAAAEQKLAAKSRKEDTRLKVLIGAACLSDLEKHPELRENIEAIVRRAITKPNDRAFLQSQGWLLGGNGKEGKQGNGHATA